MVDQPVVTRQIQVRILSPEPVSEEVMQKQKRMYPPDGGLKEQVRPLGETFNVWDVIRDHFLKKEHGPVAQ